MNTETYRELRVLIEDLTRAWPTAIEHRAIEEARAYLRTHCRTCGARLTVEEIERRHDCCATCAVRLYW